MVQDPSHRPWPPARLDDTSSDEAEDSESDPEEDVVHYAPDARVELVGDGGFDPHNAFWVGKEKFFFAQCMWSAKLAAQIL